MMMMTTIIIIIIVYDKIINNELIDHNKYFLFLFIC